MTDLSNCYRLLGINKDSSVEEIKRAYRTKAKELHPDITGNSNEAFVSVKEAYEYVIAHIHNKSNSSNNTSTTTPKHNETQWYSQESYKNYSYYEEMGFGKAPTYKDLYEDDVTPPPFISNTRGADICLDVNISYEEQSQAKILGTIFKKVSYKRQIQCVSCKGKGYKTYSCIHCSGNGYKTEVSYSPSYGRATTSTKCGVCSGNGYLGNVSDKCLHCRGNGFIESLCEYDIPIDVINMIERGQKTLVFEGLGHEVINPMEWGSSGDLIVNIIFQQQVSNSNTKVYINFVQAIEGCSVKVELDGGRFNPEVTIPSGIKSGTKLKVSKGNNQYLIEVLITVPKWEDINKKGRKLITQLKEEL